MTVSRTDQYLTATGRALLSARIVRLDATLADLRVAIRDPEARVESVGAYLRAARERDRLASLLAESAVVEDVVVDDPLSVDVGDSVLIRLDDGSAERYVIVHSAEAGLDAHRISVDAPLGRALLGRRVGETVDIVAPAGSYACTILRATRATPSTPAGSRGCRDRARRGRPGHRARGDRGR